ncbi:hypothetical protein G7054_g4707 [Neopestalotiopsis clavispora]|nr:hypothetical protein G7054_g4707 [Neopestalotiopsis clavispora]
MPKVRSSRRVAPLKESDIDHEINLIDHSTSSHGTPARAPTPSPQEDGDTTVDQSALTSDSERPLRANAAPISTSEEGGSEYGDVQNGHASHESAGENGELEIPPTPSVQPPTPAAEEPRPNGSSQDAHSVNGNRVSRVPSSKSAKRQSRRPKSPQKEIDILYENERGGFLCGIPLFSGAALGNLDPSPWTNAAHKTSPTDIKTAQVPDPSWEWAWPSWHVNKDDKIETDKEGWEYSFMFSKKFSWHGPRWYNSFVRRRAWIRQRMKKDTDLPSSDPHLLNPEYFTVGAASPAKSGSVRGSSSLGGGASSNRTSVIIDEDEALEAKIEIQTIDHLMELLRKLRIDREKLDAIQNYVEHSTDGLAHLQDHMHEIMSIFVFQASRKLLLTRMMELYDGYTYQKQQSSPSEEAKSEPEPPTVRLQSQEQEAVDGSSQTQANPSIPKEPETEDERVELEEKAKHLADAIKHADEEVRRLEYWSDVKDMAEGGVSGGAVADEKGWQDGWDGIDRSGGLGANKEELP